ncbi:MAG: hypothetical protein O7G85_00460 [Planctomycetota bacterium]|nr:hypothetical protein [Planctomycetota bacterium]
MDKDKKKAAKEQDPKPGGAAKKGRAAILFTAFEPSGDALAAPIITELLKKVPGLKIYAWGGPLMEAAGATMVERTCEGSAMGLSALSKVFAVRKQVSRIKRWMKEYRILAHVPVDSPAANFPICKIMRKKGVRIIHLVAPQIWAWGRWRLRKLRKNTDLVLCVLPFEEQWFGDRGVPARFIGHPAINRSIDPEQLREHTHGLPQGSPRLAIFPGSRPQEVKMNLPLILKVYLELQGRYSGLSGLIVAADEEIAKIVHKKVKVFPTGLSMIRGMHEEAICWADMSIAVSGTITMHIARQRKAMVGIYKTDVLTWILGKLFLRTKFILLPNIIADREIVPEFAPYIGGPGPIIRSLSEFFSDSKNVANQSEELQRVCYRFANKRPAEEATTLIIRIIKTGHM